MSDGIQVAHVELLTPTLEDSLSFFSDFLGMQTTERDDGVAYVRAYEDTYHHTLKLVEAPQAGLGHVGLRVGSHEMLMALVARLQEHDGGEWTDGERGHGPGFRVTTPTGHVLELFHEVEYFRAPPGQRSRVLNRPQKRPLQGVPVRRLDHINVMAGDVTLFREWFTDRLPFELREHAYDVDGREVGAWMSASSLMHDVAAVVDDSDVPGRLHHIGLWYGSPQHLWDVADHLVDHEIRIEHGPGKHGISQAMYLYIIEPGGNRVELFGDVGQLVFDPTWPVVRWVDDGTPTTRSSWIGNPPPPGFFCDGTPPAPGDVQRAQEGRVSAVWLP